MELSSTEKQSATTAGLKSSTNGGQRGQSSDGRIDRPAVQVVWSTHSGVRYPAGGTRK